MQYTISLLLLLWHPDAMARSLASINAEIAVIESKLTSAEGLLTSVGSDGVSRSLNREALSKRLDELYGQAERAGGTGPMFVRGVVRGL